MRRYARHVLLPDMGGRGQQRLLAGAARIPVGAGDAAAAVAVAYLAAAGVGTIHLAGDPAAVLTDADVATGIVYGRDDVGRPRIEAIRDRVAALNPDVSIVTEPVEGAVAVALEPAADLADALIRGGAAAARAVAQICRTP